MTSRASVIPGLWLVRLSNTVLSLAGSSDLSHLCGYLRYNSELIANQMLKNLIKSDWCLRPAPSSSIRRYFSNISSDHSTHGLFILITLLADQDPDDSRMTRWSWCVLQSSSRLSGLSLQLSRRNLIGIIGKNCQLGGVSMKDYHLIVIGGLTWFMSKRFVWWT